MAMATDLEGVGGKCGFYKVPTIEVYSQSLFQTQIEGGQII